MKAVSSFLTMIAVAAMAFSFVSCSDGDGNGGGMPGGEYFEITMGGKSQKMDIQGTTVSGNGTYSFIQSEDIYPWEFLLAYYSNLDEVANAETGDYRFCPNSGVQLFDFDLGCETDGYYLDCNSGSHTITSIERKGSGVIVEGRFSGLLGSLPISGRYRIELY